MLPQKALASPPLDCDILTVCFRPGILYHLRGVARKVLQPARHSRREDAIDAGDRSHSRLHNCVVETYDMSQCVVGHPTLRFMCCNGQPGESDPAGPFNLPRAIAFQPRHERAVMSRIGMRGERQHMQFGVESFKNPKTSSKEPGPAAWLAASLVAWWLLEKNASTTCHTSAAGANSTLCRAKSTAATTSRLKRREPGGEFPAPGTPKAPSCVAWQCAWEDCANRRSLLSLF